MTGVTQSQAREVMARPKGGKSYQTEERLIQDLLDAAHAQRIVSDLWPRTSPAQIAQVINSKHRGLGITARWVEGIKRRIDKRTLTP